jgi:hypothetical protein
MSGLTFSVSTTPFIAAILQVMTEPYQTLIAALYRDGRVTDAEVAELRQAILDRGERLPDLVQAELQAAAPGSPATDPGRL